MSLKAIKEALEDLKRKADDVGDDGSWNLALQAKEEMVALEKAAKALWVNGVLSVLKERNQLTQPERKAVDVLATIAKEAE